MRYRVPFRPLPIDQSDAVYELRRLADSVRTAGAISFLW